MSIDEAKVEVQKFQRHWLLRQYGEDGHVLPKNLKLSRALDVILSAVPQAEPTE